MLRQHMLTGNKDALREAVLLGKAWGITREWTMHGLAASALYTGFEGLYTAHAAVDDVFAELGHGVTLRTFTAPDIAEVTRLQSGGARSSSSKRGGRTD